MATVLDDRAANEHDDVEHTGFDHAAHEALLQRRIDGPGPKRTVKRASRGRQFAGGAAMLTAVGLGLQQVFDPPAEEEVVLEVDATEPLGDRWVTFEYDPASVARSRIHLRPWLARVP